LQGIEQYTVSVRGGEGIDSADGAQAIRNEDGKIIGLQVSLSTVNNQYAAKYVTVHFSTGTHIKTARPAKAGRLVLCNVTDQHNQ
jgi:hypothetical protein